MDGHWADQIIRDIDVLSDDRYARFPFSDNVHVRRLVDAYQRLGALHFAEPGVESERQNLRIRIHNVFKRMEERQVSLVVAGGWNAGKSTVINAFLGESWMPMNVNRETVTVNRILGGSERYLHVHFREGHLPRQLRQAYQDVDFVHHKIREFGESHRDAIERIDICYPGHPFLTWLALIDTPGLDFSARDDRVSQPLIDDADVLVWVMHIEGPRQHDLAALRAFRRRNPGSRLLAVVNYADMYDESEWGEILADKQSSLGEEADAVFLVSARSDLEARGADPGFSQLRAYLNEHVLPAYGELRWRKPSRLASDSLGQIQAFIENVRHQPLKAANPFRLAGRECWTAHELAIAAGQYWEQARAELLDGHLSRWLREELQDQPLAKALDELRSDATLYDDARLLYLLALLAPGRHLMWHGVSLEKSALIKLAHQARQDEKALHNIIQLYHRQVLRLCTNAAPSLYGDYRLIQDDWEKGFRLCHAALRPTQKQPIIADFNENRLLPWLLLLQLDEGVEANLRQQLEDVEGVDLASLRRVLPWYRDLGDPDTNPALLPLLQELAWTALREYRWNQALRKNSSAGYEEFLKPYPEGPFSAEAKKNLSELLRKELVRDPDNPPLRRHYLKRRTRAQREEDYGEYCILGIPLNIEKAKLSRDYGPLPNRNIAPENASRELLDE
jgi:hypothetical protein